MTNASPYQDDESRWEAVRTRNIHADGFFFYGVRSTRIYCRPGCKARLARRANVYFYASATEAQAAGFRACKRCKPEVVGFMPEEKAVRRIREFVNDAAASAASTNDIGTGGDGSGVGGWTGQSMSLASMAKEAGLSKWHFHRVFKKCTGKTPVEYLRLMRHNRQLGPGSSNKGYESAATSGLSGQEDLLLLRYCEPDNPDAPPSGREKEALTSASLGLADLPSSSSNHSGLFDVDASLDDILDWPDDWWNTWLNEG